MSCADKFSAQTACDKGQISIMVWNIRRYLILLELSAGISDFCLSYLWGRKEAVQLLYWQTRACHWHKSQIRVFKHFSGSLEFFSISLPIEAKYICGSLKLYSSRWSVLFVHRAVIHSGWCCLQTMSDIIGVVSTPNLSFLSNRISCNVYAAAHAACESPISRYYPLPPPTART